MGETVRLVSILIPNFGITTTVATPKQVVMPSKRLCYGNRVE
jgi:hypothetical protein